MNKIKVMLVVLLAAFAVQGTMAQERTKKFPYVFFGVQGGGQAVMNGYNVSDVITGTAGVYVGGMWTPVWGNRIHVNGWQSKEGVKDWGAYDFKYGTATADLLFNLVSAINHRDDNAVDFYLVGGIGANKVWGHNYPAPLSGAYVHNHATYAGKLGVLMDVNFSRNVALDLEIDAYRHGPHDKDYYVNMSKDWQLTAQLGLKFSFPGKVKKAAPEVVIPEVVQPEPAPAPEAKPVVKPEVKPEPAPVVKTKEKLRKEIFFVIKSASAEGDNAVRLQEAIAWLNAHPTATATIDGYADHGTGSAAINAKIAEQRAQTVKNALVKGGIAADRLTVKSYGDTVQPFAENDKNRCVIIVAEEK